MLQLLLGRALPLPLARETLHLHSFLVSEASASLPARGSFRKLPWQGEDTMPRQVFFLICCRARHDSCDGRYLTKRVGKQLVAVTRLRSKLEDLFTNTDTSNKNQTPPKKQQGKRHTKEIFGGETVKRQTYRLQTLKASLTCSRPARNPHLPIAQTS